MENTVIQPQIDPVVPVIEPVAPENLPDVQKIDHEQEYEKLIYNLYLTLYAYRICFSQIFNYLFVIKPAFLLPVEHIQLVKQTFSLSFSHSETIKICFKY